MTLSEEIQHGESRTLEFKAELPRESEKWIKTVVAFANGAGGRIVVGVNDDRQIVGIPKETDIFELMDGIADTIAQTCEPQIMFDITAEKINDAQLLILRVFPCNATPYYITKYGRKNGTFIRLGATTRPADWTALDELQFRGKRIFYDSLIDPEIQITDEDINYLCKDFSERAKREITRSDLINFRLLVGENKNAATNALAILLGKHDFTSRIQCALFKGVTRTYFLDKKEFEGPLCSQIDGAFNFVLTHVKMALEIKGIVHDEIYEIPIAAVRELIINAAVHRNYQMTSSIQVAVYDDRVEISSPGTLYGALTIEEAVRGHSALRNPVLARTLEKIGVIEGWGSGLKRITELCKNYTPGFNHLEIQEIGDMLRFNIYRPRSNNGQNETENEGLNAKNEGLTDNSEGKTSQKLPRNFPETSQKLPNNFPVFAEKTFYALMQNPSATINDLSKLLGISDRSIKTHINELKKTGFIKRVGSDRSGYWEVLNPTL
ncbi:MAG: putative DNA binding domain-containing protein [Bacteroidales bacterium]|nr:putative DNA binding domain-containing protein [Bacteroidales bacterium]